MFLVGIMAFVFLSSGSGYAFVIAAVFATGGDICKLIEKQQA